jgi:hypothetical protein
MSQHNFQEILRFGSHLLHTSQTIVKGSQKRDLLQMSLQEMYQLECYENAIKQDNKETPREGPFKYNHFVTYY